MQPNNTPSGPPPSHSDRAALIAEINRLAEERQAQEKAERETFRRRSFALDDFAQQCGVPFNSHANMYDETFGRQGYSAQAAEGWLERFDRAVSHLPGLTCLEQHRLRLNAEEIAFPEVARTREVGRAVAEEFRKNGFASGLPSEPLDDALFDNDPKTRHWFADALSDAAYQKELRRAYRGINWAQALVAAFLLFALVVFGMAMRAENAKQDQFKAAVEAAR